MDGNGVSVFTIFYTARKRYLDLIVWLLFNVGIGTASIWLSWILLLLTSNPAFTWSTQIEKGALAVFVVTLCGGQAALFAELTENRFFNINRLALGVFTLLVILSASIGVTATSADAVQVPPLQPASPTVNVSAVLWTSIVVFVVAVLFCLYMYTARLVSDEFKPRQRADDLIRDAQSHTEVDGVQL